MCDLKSQPWRATFTGPPCRCGVPTPGNDEELAIHERERGIQENKKYLETPEARKKRLGPIYEATKKSIAPERERRINELFKKYGY